MSAVNLRILVVDDSAATRTMLQAAVEALAREHHQAAQVDMADSGLSALRALPSGRYDLILTDINMPEVHGLELIRFVRQHALQKDTPILVVSTLQLGATAYLVKPVTLGALRDVVRPFWPGGVSQ